MEFKIAFCVNSPLLEVLKRLVYELNMLCIVRKPKSTLRQWCGTVWKLFRCGLMPLGLLMRYSLGVYTVRLS